MVNSKTRWIVGASVIAAVAILVLLVWPTSDPLAGVETVAVQVDGDATLSQAFDFRLN